MPEVAPEAELMLRPREFRTSIAISDELHNLILEITRIRGLNFNQFVNLALIRECNSEKLR